MMDDFLPSINAAIPPAAYAKAHPNGYGEAGYNNAALYAAQVLLNAAKRDPVTFGDALDIFRRKPFTNVLDALLTPAEHAAIINGKFGVTGFQWGWAVNIVAMILEQEPVPNPAILIVDDAHA